MYFNHFFAKAFSFSIHIARSTVSILADKQAKNQFNQFAVAALYERQKLLGNEVRRSQTAATAAKLHNYRLMVAGEIREYSLRSPENRHH